MNHEAPAAISPTRELAGRGGVVLNGGTTSDTRPGFRAAPGARTSAGYWTLIDADLYRHRGGAKVMAAFLLIGLFALAAAFGLRGCARPPQADHQTQPATTSAASGVSDGMAIEKIFQTEKPRAMTWQGASEFIAKTKQTHQ